MTELVNPQMFICPDGSNRRQITSGDDGRLLREDELSLFNPSEGGVVCPGGHLERSFIHVLEIVSLITKNRLSLLEKVGIQNETCCDTTAIKRNLYSRAAV